MSKPTRPSGSKKQRAAARRRAARRRRLTRRVASVALGLAATAAIVALAAGGTAANGSTDPVSWDLPAMGATRDVQDRVALADFRGQPTVVNFFASWCTACDAELPGFARVSEQLAGQVAFVGVASQETGDPLLMPRRHGVDWWTLARDTGGHTGDGLSRALGARGMPLTAFYDADGQLVHVQLGALTEPQLRASIGQLYGIST